uniref:Uncharacterized protein n=1 Tax=uncultured bacterium esnapd22 TaxID=1366604 RepID=S5TN97_9BACT|nr:hypothetical protein [uncultured bacterium esnapd22]
MNVFYILAQEVRQHGSDLLIDSKFRADWMLVVDPLEQRPQSFWELMSKHFEKVIESPIEN